MRLIDADVLEENMYHEAFEKDTDLQRWDSGCWIRYRMFTDMLKSTPTVEPSAEPDQKWIPCSKLLPKEGESAILRYSNGKISGGRYIGNRVWYVDYGDSDKTVSVTAWMPLPEPYKEGRTDEVD